MFDIGELFESIGDAIKEAILNMIGTLLYYITVALMWIIQILQQLFDVFSGQTKVKYNGDYEYLTTVFLENQSVKNVYWGMALIGMLFVFFFGLIAVIRKFFDLSDKHANQSYGTILGSMFRAIFTMLIIGVAMNAILDLTNVVISRIGYIFDNADSLHVEREIVFSPEEYAAMARIYQTIGNYSLNQSYDNRYNLNKCYNEIRSDLDWLADEGVFQYTYVTKDEAGYEIDTWQSVLQELYIASNTEREITLDVYHEAVSDQLLHIMSILRTNASFPALERYENPYTVSDGVGLDRVIFLSGTMSAANNSKFNEKPYMTDAVRGAFFVGEKSIYDLDEVSGSFQIALGGIKYIMIWLVAYFTIRNLLRCIFSCIMRIFNMVSLYLIAPLTAASIPLDDGEKFKQWIISMTVQCLGVLGVIIPMRLVILFTPIILGEKLVLFPDSTILNFIGKVLMIVGAMEAVEGFGHTVTGILANNASMAALNAGNAANALGDKAFGMMKGAASGAAGLAADVTGLSTLGGMAANAIGGGLSKAGKAMKEHGGLVGALIHASRKGKSDASSGKKDGGGGKDSGGKDSGGKGSGGEGGESSGSGPQNLNDSGKESDAGSGPQGDKKNADSGSSGSSSGSSSSPSSLSGTGGESDQSSGSGDSSQSSSGSGGPDGPASQDLGTQSGSTDGGSEPTNLSGTGGESDQSSGSEDSSQSDPGSSGPESQDLGTQSGSTDGGAEPQNLGEMGGESDQSQSGGDADQSQSGGDADQSQGGGESGQSQGGGEVGQSQSSVGTGSTGSNSTGGSTGGGTAPTKAPTGSGGSAPKSTGGSTGGGTAPTKASTGAGGSAGASPTKTPPPIPPRKNSAPPKMGQQSFDKLFGAGSYQKYYGGGGSSSSTSGSVSGGNTGSRPTSAPSGNTSTGSAPQVNQQQFDKLFGAGSYQQYHGGGGSSSSTSGSVGSGNMGSTSTSTPTSAPPKTPPPGASAADRLNSKLNK